MEVVSLDCCPYVFAFSDVEWQGGALHNFLRDENGELYPVERTEQPQSLEQQLAMWRQV